MSNQHHVVSLYITDICLLVSILFTVSLIFKTSPQVARGVCDSRSRLKFKLIYNPLFFHSVCRNAVPSLYFEPQSNLLKKLEGLIYSDKSLNITVYVCYSVRVKGE